MRWDLSGAQTPGECKYLRAQILVVGDGEAGRKALADLCPVDVRPLEELA